MTRLNKILLAVLAVQVLLATAAWWPRESGSVQAHALLTLEKDKIQRIVVQRSGDDVEPVELQREGENWKLASSHGFPAKKETVDELIDNLLGVQVRQPIATKAVNHDKLNVGDKEWGKKLTIEADGGSTALVVGAASGKAVHMRLADSDEVYQARGFSEWSIKDRASAYWDASYVEIDKASLSAFSIVNAQGTISMQQADGEWVLDGELPEGGVLDLDEVDSLLSKLVKLRMQEPVGVEVEPAHWLQPPAVEVSCTVAEDDATSTVSYAIGAEDDGKYFAKAAGQDFVVKVSKWSVEALLEASLEGLLVGAEEEE